MRSTIKSTCIGFLAVAVTAGLTLSAAPAVADKLDNVIAAGKLRCGIMLAMQLIALLSLTRAGLLK
ncbi:MAG TPA: hypothetical protein VNN09_11945 [Candidatus Competibacteraceae bacterium]|nr:hypothetical protein [Candidatus Competibacteraceae bacterium]